jgi:hypothetical protein
MVPFNKGHVDQSPIKFFYDNSNCEDIHTSNYLHKEISFYN